MVHRADMMEEEQEHGRHWYVRMPPEPPEPEGLAATSSASFRLPESTRVFDELLRARIVGVLRPDARDITAMLLSYTIEVHYKQVRPRVETSWEMSSDFVFKIVGNRW